LFGVLAGIYAGRSHSRAWLHSVTNSTIAVGICAVVSLVVLAIGFATDDYSVQYIWQFSNRDMDLIYKITAIWGGMDGSMLLWAGMLAVMGALVAWNSRKQSRLLMPWVLAVINSSSMFFLTITLFLTNPFRYIRADFIPPDGNGLNPLLQNPYMAVHPPTLYLGFTTLSVPFAFCMGALLSGQISNEWIRLTRRWTLIGWGFLTAGIVLGGHWAYLELGWGGFWAWDPVENSSFLPWLTATAFLHSVMVQERKNMLKIWNIWLVTLTYGLTVFGTFLTRSGVVQSVHAFASTDIGWVFLVYLAFLFLLTAGMIWYRRAELRSERKIESVLSRESAFLVNNLIFLSITFAVFWGVMFPVFSEWLGDKKSIGQPFFNAINVPLFLLMILMMGVGPLIAWRKADPKRLLNTLIWPLLGGLALALVLVWGGVPGFYPPLAYGLCFFVLLAIGVEMHRGLRVQRAASGENGSLVGDTGVMLRSHRSRYGGYLVHVGVLVVSVAITASMAHKTEQEFTLLPGESFEIGRYLITLDGMKEIENPNYVALHADATVTIAKSGKFDTVLSPELRRYKRSQETTTEVALRMSLRDDLYLILAGVAEDGNRAAMKVFINPLQVWLWFGALIMLAGTVVVILPGAQQTVTVAEVSDATERA